MINTQFIIGVVLNTLIAAAVLWAPVAMRRWKQVVLIVLIGCLLTYPLYLTLSRPNGTPPRPFGVLTFCMLYGLGLLFAAFVIRIMRIAE